MAYNTLCGTVNFCDDSGSIESMVDDYSNQTIAGRKTFSTPVTASAFYDSTSGAPLTTAAIRSISGDGAKRVVVSDGDGTATAYAGFTFDGSALTSSYFSGSAAGLLAIPLHSHKVVGNLSASNIYFGLGLENSSETLAVKGGNSITVGAGGVAVDLATTGGLAHTGGKLRVNPNDATAKGSLSNNDSFLLSDSDASNVLKKATMSALGTYMQSTLTFIGPGGSNNQIQYKNGSAFAGSSNLTFTSNTLTTVNISSSGYVSSSQFVGNGSGLTGITGVNASGVNQSVQFNSGSAFSGSANLIFDFSAGTNALKMTGDMSASNDILGGRDLSLLRDLGVGRHISATGQISASANISASAFYGQGHTLTTAPINNYTANRLVLCGASSNTLDTTANLAWNNPTLNVPGNVVASNLSGAAMNINGTARVTGSLEITGSDAHLLVLHAKGSDTTREIVFRKDYTTDAGSLYINSSEHMFLRNETNTKDIVFRTFNTNPLRIFGSTARVGIGNKTAAAATLDVDGDTVVTGSITAVGDLEVISGSTEVFEVDTDAQGKGRMLARQTFVKHHNMEFGSQSKRFITMTGQATHTAAPTEQTAIVMPYNGRLLKVIYMQGGTPGASSNDKVEFGFYTGSTTSGGGGTPQFPSAYVDSTTIPSAQFTASVATVRARYTIDLTGLPTNSGSFTFTAGQMVAISMDPDVDVNPGDTFITTIWEYDLFNEIT